MEDELRALIWKYGIDNIHKTFNDIMYHEFMYLSWMFEEKVACIYGICSKSDNKCIYVGSSFHYYNRIRWHQYEYIRFPKRKLYKLIRESGGWEKYYFGIIKNIDNDEIIDMYSIEKKYFMILKPIGNSLTPPDRKILG